MAVGWSTCQITKFSGFTVCENDTGTLRASLIWKKGHGTMGFLTLSCMTIRLTLKQEFEESTLFHQNKTCTNLQEMGVRGKQTKASVSLANHGIPHTFPQAMVNIQVRLQTKINHVPSEEDMYMYKSTRDGRGIQTKASVHQTNPLPNKAGKVHFSLG